MSEDKKESVEAKTTETTSTPDNKTAEEVKTTEEVNTTEDAAKKAEAAAQAAEEAVIAAREALAKAEAAKAEAESAAEEEYKAIAAEVKAESAKKPAFTFKRQGEEIFRREMGEPEFFLHKKDRFPRPILSAEEQEALTRQAEIPKDQTPAYVPENILSPEYEGLSNYERGVGDFLEEAQQKLESLKNNPEATEKEISDAKEELTYLESLHENYFIGMNVFRTAKGGRNKVKS